MAARCVIRSPSWTLHKHNIQSRRPGLLCGRMRAARHLLALLFAASLIGVAACGSDEQSAAPPPEPATAKPADFPSAVGKTRQELVGGLPEGPIFAPSTSNLNVGDNRFGFALFDAAQKQVEASAVAI